LVATAGDGSVELDWSAPASTGGSPITGYLVRYRFVDGDDVEQIVTVGPGHLDRTLRITGLDNGVEYRFEVAAINEAGTSAFSGVVTATPTDSP
jgi:hypothetical protein